MGIILLIFILENDYRLSILDEIVVIRYIVLSNYSLNFASRQSQFNSKGDSTQTSNPAHTKSRSYDSSNTSTCLELLSIGNIEALIVQD